MRRLSAFLMMAVLVAALVPSAALAAKPVPSIGHISVVSVGDYVEGMCRFEVHVRFTGRAFDVWFGQLKNNAGDGAMTALADNKAGSAITSFTAPLVGSADYQWQAVLRDRKGKEISVMRTTGIDSFTGTGCPAYGTVIATFPEA